MIKIHLTSPEDIPQLYHLYDKIGQKDEGYFERCFEEGRTLLMAERKGVAVGFGMLNWKPKYALYKKLGIPEIQDLNVVPAARQKGVASVLIQKFEMLAQEKKAEYIGVSVGLTKAYGPAQCLYTKLGYVADGNGVSYDRQPVSHGEYLSIDDDLCLMLIKGL